MSISICFRSHRANETEAEQIRRARRLNRKTMCERLRLNVIHRESSVKVGARSQCVYHCQRWWRSAIVDSDNMVPFDCSGRNRDGRPKPRRKRDFRSVWHEFRWTEIYETVNNRTLHEINNTFFSLVLSSSHRLSLYSSAIFFHFLSLCLSVSHRSTPHFTPSVNMRCRIQWSISLVCVCFVCFVSRHVHFCARSFTPRLCHKPAMEHPLHVPTWIMCLGCSIIVSYGLAWDRIGPQITHAMPELHTSPKAPFTMDDWRVAIVETFSKRFNDLYHLFFSNDNNPPIPLLSPSLIYSEEEIGRMEKVTFFFFSATLFSARLLTTIWTIEHNVYCLLWLFCLCSSGETERKQIKAFNSHWDWVNSYIVCSVCLCMCVWNQLNWNTFR